MRIINKQGKWRRLKQGDALLLARHSKVVKYTDKNALENQDVLVTEDVETNQFEDVKIKYIT